VFLAERALMKRRVPAVNLVRLRRRGRTTISPDAALLALGLRPAAAAILRLHG
jgi:hypothetical protein